MNFFKVKITLRSLPAALCVSYFNGEFSLLLPLSAQFTTRMAHYNPPGELTRHFTSQQLFRSFCCPESDFVAKGRWHTLTRWSMFTAAGGVVGHQAAVLSVESRTSPLIYGPDKLNHKSIGQNSLDKKNLQFSSPQMTPLSAADINQCSPLSANLRSWRAKKEEKNPLRCASGEYVWRL